MIGEFQKPTVGILKHTNPCGVASDEDLVKAWEKLLPQIHRHHLEELSLSIIPLIKHLLRLYSSIFSEVIIAPSFTDEALEIFGKKKNLRLMIANGSLPADSLREVRSVIGGLLLQDRDMGSSKVTDWES